jgi:hypothetical protein
MFRRRSDRRSESEAPVIQGNSVAGRIALVVAGISIGSGIALLAAPSSGEEVRHAIGRRYRHAVKRIGRNTEDLRDRIADLLEQATDLGSSSSRLLGFRRRSEIERRRSRVA